MNGFRAKINNQQVLGALPSGITGLLITVHPDGTAEITFSSLDATGMLAYIWYSSSLSLEDNIHISFQEVECSTAAQRIVNYSDKKSIEKMEIESYYRIKAELIAEGLIDGNE